MTFKEFYISDNDGKSNCVIRSLCKILNKEYNDVYNDLCKIAEDLKCDSFNDIPVFEKYMEDNNIFNIDYDKDIMIKDLNLNDNSYIVFCWNKKDYYHMLPIIDNVIYTIVNIISGVLSKHLTNIGFTTYIAIIPANPKGIIVSKHTLPFIFNFLFE